MKKTLAAAALLLALAGLTGCTNDANPARITGPATPITKVAEATQAPKPEVQPTKAAEPVPVAEPVATAPAAPVVPAEVVPAPVQPAAIDWAADAWSVFKTDGFGPGVLEAAFKVTYLGTWSDKVHFGTAPDVEVVPSQAHPGFFHFFAVSKGQAQKSEVKPTPVCQEDQACWDCKTMGNKICGPTVVSPVLVTFTAPTLDNSNGLPVIPVEPEGVFIDPSTPNQMSEAGWVVVFHTKPGYIFPNGSDFFTQTYKTTCADDLIDLLQNTKDHNVKMENVTGFLWDGKNCTIETNVTEVDN